MSMIDAEDIAAMKDSKKELLELHEEWRQLIEEVTDMSVKVYALKDNYQELSDRIIAVTDFKKLYGANNQKVRDNHVKKELEDDHNEIKSLEFRIDYVHRRIVYLKELIRTKRLLLELKE